MTALHNKDNTYYKLSGNSYKSNITNRKTTKIKKDDSVQNFKIQASRIDKANGFQAMALSPIDSNGKVDNDTVYMVYAGTEPKEPADIGTDVKLGLSGIFDDQIKTNPKDVKFYDEYQDLSKKPFIMNFPIGSMSNRTGRFKGRY
ncbi:hypothetical protein [Staphylococcus lugdunensis]|uniref:hypothetical protein n=1 Tax=Staphylococcus lugdunensis TaxID=28035 RepID=UPI001EEF0305|nr:hypothetical protein [Staphylococcus lugdunensis]